MGVVTLLLTEIFLISVSAIAQTTNSVSFRTPDRGGTVIQTIGGTSQTVVGYALVQPSAGSTAPSTSAVFSFAQNGVVVSRAAVQTQRPALAFRTYIEANANPGFPGAVESGIAIANNSAATATVNFELTGLDGASTGLTSTVFIPPSGHVSKIIKDLFPTLSVSFQGILRITSASTISVVSLRMRYNERGDLLLTTMPVSNEGSPSTAAELIFPQIADQGGYSTEFILFSGVFARARPAR